MPPPIPGPPGSPFPRTRRPRDSIIIISSNSQILDGDSLQVFERHPRLPLLDLDRAARSRREPELCLMTCATPAPRRDRADGLDLHPQHLHRRAGERSQMLPASVEYLVRIQPVTQRDCRHRCPAASVPSTMPRLNSALNRRRRTTPEAATLSEPIGLHLANKALLNFEWVMLHED